jgi:hypothetical protein
MCTSDPTIILPMILLPITAALPTKWTVDARSSQVKSDTALSMRQRQNVEALALAFL